MIHRFSEDIDILIHPETALPVGRNHTKAAHIAARQAFFDSLAQRISISGVEVVERDGAFDDPTGQMRGAGIRLHYPELNPLPAGVKTGVLLEAGFDQVLPNRPITISSWAYDFAVGQGVANLTDNRAVDVPCYEPGYTFVEKLQTISTKFRQQQATVRPRLRDNPCALLSRSAYAGGHPRSDRGERGPTLGRYREEGAGQELLCGSPAFHRQPLPTHWASPGSGLAPIVPEPAADDPSLWVLARQYGQGRALPALMSDKGELYRSHSA